MADSIDYSLALIEWRSNQQKRLLERHPNSQTPYDYTEQFHSEIKNKDSIVISIGDSWTWGDSLEDDLRLQQVYGSIIKQQLDSDWINIGCRGFSNSFILENLMFLLPMLQSSNYKKIIVVIALTENGRDLQSFPSFRYDYQKLHSELGLCNLFYETLLTAIENNWVTQLQKFLSQTDSRFTTILGQNFIWHHDLAEKLQDQVIFLQNNWIERLAHAQQLDKPLRTTLVTGFVFDHCINSVHNFLEVKDKTEFKKWALPYLDRANKVNAWLDTSPMNYKKASKHPTAEGHLVWADYILQNLSDQL
jgi:hypothetical protein